MQILTILDYLLLPVYFILFYVFARMAANKQASPILKKYYIWSFLLHMFGAVLFTLIVQYYYGGGDAFTYYLGGEFIRSAGHETGRTVELFFMKGKDLFDFSQTYEMNEIPRYGMQTPATLAMEKLSGILSFFSFHSLMVISLFMGRFAFLGQWKLFLAFNDRLKEKHQKLLAFAVLFTPSVWFWGSGLGKDAICMGALGYLGHAAYMMFFKRKVTLRNFLAIIICLLILLIIKSYIAAAFIAAAGAAVLIGFIQARKTRAGKIFTGIFLAGAVAALFTFVFVSYVQQMIDESAKTIETFSESYSNANLEDERSKGSFEAGEIDISLGGFIKQAPEKVFSTLYRPFIWEAGKPIILFSALESLLMMLGFLYILWRCRIFGFFRYLFSDAGIMFSFTFSIVLAAVIGFTTFNFGTLVRYRLPLLPFSGFMLICIYTKVKEKKELKKLKPQVA